MRIEEEIERRAGIRLDDLVNERAFQDEVAYAKMADRVMRLQDAMRPLISAGQRFEKAAMGEDWSRFATCWNFLVRAMHQSLGVMALMEDENIMDAAVLNRSILERALLLEWLRETTGFELFRKFTRVQEYRHKETWIRHHPGQGKGMISAEERAEATKFERELKAAGWARPRMKDVAAKMGVRKMYDGIYDFSSGYVHPLFGEGSALFLAKIGKPPEGFAESKSIIFGQTASALGLLCVVSSATLGKPKAPALQLLECISDVVLGKTNPWIDAAITEAFTLQSTDLFEPWASRSSNPPQS